MKEYEATEEFLSLIELYKDMIAPSDRLMEIALTPLNRGPHPLTGETVKTEAGYEILVEGWFEQIFGTPYILTEMDRPPWILYLCRIMDKSVPFDNDVVVVRGRSSSGLLHNSEIPGV